ncbi:hypothetical protein PLICRDRAFT_94725 [Plicaturopsis crispa FD-325 SS-3]|uniref:MYND-type domain-containing protein n=1 Tax=Plicaturopsis crispa FD-325 SS-3 TaxID=944288 RepID=A0A0C9SLA5_PLICR|nr:hypothetical protein PLICRDRAFT_94725 [Plicaturopsis crispa FD-325 SS-3]
MAGEPLDLHEVSTLMNYERASTEPRFRHAKLRELALDGAFDTRVSLPSGVWGSQENHPVKRGFIFDAEKPSGLVPEKDLPDLPSNMLGGKSLASTKDLTEADLELIYREARDHDGCYTAVSLFQHFFDLFPPATPLRVRTASGTDFETKISARVILEFYVFAPRQVSVSKMLPLGQTYITGSDNKSLHAVVGFGRPGAQNVEVVADLASMQFGIHGRGSGGEMFQLEPMDRWYDFIERVAQGLEPAKAGAARITRHPWGDDWLKGCAERVKDRWDNRSTKPWCAFCGAPSPTKRCPCKGPWYCSPAHQRSAWKFHKRYCTVQSKK